MNTFEAIQGHNSRAKSEISLLRRTILKSYKKGEDYET
jgi:hypothetical protein